MTVKNPLYAKCPSCSSADTLRKSRGRSTFEKIVRTVTWFDIYRCKKCGWRGFKSSFMLSFRVVKKILLYILMMIFTAFVVWQVLIRIA